MASWYFYVRNFSCLVLEASNVFFYVFGTDVEELFQSAGVTEIGEMSQQTPRLLFFFLFLQLSNGVENRWTLQLVQRSGIVIIIIVERFLFYFFEKKKKIIAL